jgi:hypothetical protein
MPNYSGIWTEQAVMQAVGAGNWPGVPGAPTIGTATGGNASASVTFTAPSNTNNSPITSYTVTSSPGSVTASGASSPITVTGLTNGTAYTFTVTATNAQGTGPASAASNSVTPAAPNYIEDVFSTYLYAGNGSTQTITNSINLSGNGGLVWTKSRTDAYGQRLSDTARGIYQTLFTNDTAAQEYDTSYLTAFNSNGFSLGYVNNLNSNNYASWTFRKQPKFFDVVTYTGNGVLGNTVAHNLQSVPGCIIWKRLDSASDWGVWHIGSGMATSKNGGSLNLTNGFLYTLDATPYQTSTTFSPAWVNDAAGNNGNTNGASYVAYLFATNAGGFGLTGADNVISCGSFTTAGSGRAVVNLGWEPQFILVKRTNAANNWQMVDNMRGLGGRDTTNWGNTSVQLNPNLANAENTTDLNLGINSSGFNYEGSSSSPYIYIAIRRGPMAVPTVGTSVFAPSTAIEPQTTPLFTAGFSDVTLHKGRLSGAAPNFLTDRLRGNGQALQASLTDASTFYSTYFKYDSNAGAYIPASGYYNNSGGGTDPYALYAFRRAPQFVDEVILNSSTTTYTHNLTVSPELMFVKCTDVGGANWVVYSKSLSTPTQQYLNLNNTNSAQTQGPGTWAVSSTQFSVDPGLWANGSVGVSYLFATCAGVSKVGSYTGTGALLTVDCAFTTGARFVLIKRTDSTGDWYVWDSARGITGGNDPYWRLNTQAAEVTGTNYVDTTAVGFQVTAAAPAGLNASGGTYIFLAIA